MKDLLEKVNQAEISEQGAKAYYEELKENGDLSSFIKTAYDEWQNRIKDTREAYVTLTRAYIKHKAKQVVNE